MNNLSEEEIIENLEDLLEYISTKFTKRTKYVNVCISKGNIQAIQGLLDLYNKEKEKRMELEGKLAKRQWIRVKNNGDVEPLFYISKDKIKKFIKEELPDDEIMECCECFDINGILIRKKLEELLEE